MKNFDNFIRITLKKELEKPKSFEYSVQNAFSRNKNKRSKIMILRLLAITSCFFVVCGVAFAIPYINEKIWREPIITNIEEEENFVKEEILEEERKNYISEKEAIEISNDILNKLGYSGIKFNEAILQRGYDSNYDVHYILKSDSILININPKNGKLEYFGDTSLTNAKIKNDNINEKEVRKIAEKIYSKLDLIDDDYEIVNSGKIKIASGKNINEFYEVSYAKLFNGKYDKSSKSTICFAVYKGDILILSLTGMRNSNYENNPVILSKAEAESIAVEKEKEFSSLEISRVESELSIEKMNIFIYCLENNVTNENGELKVDDISRNVWVVNIIHEKTEKPKDKEIDTVKEKYNKKYFIDATTGEIIGGVQSEFK